MGHSTRNIRLSLLATAAGWLAGVGLYTIVYWFQFSTFDLTFLTTIAGWFAVFSGVTWLVLIVPAIKWLRPPFVVVASVAGYLTAFLLLVGWWTGYWRSPLLLACAAVMGATVGLSYTIGLSSRDSNKMN
jgi:hypothetical protein